MKTTQKLTVSTLLLTGLATTASADHPIEEVEVLGAGDSNSITLTADNLATPDSADLLKKLPGANANSNGPLSSLAQYRGMFGPRIQVNIDGMGVTGGGPNAMDAPLSYAPGAMVQSVTVYRGIAPVSAAQQAVGGVFAVNTNQGEFTDSNTWETHGTVAASAGSAAGSQALFAHVITGNNQHKVRIAALDESGDDYEYPEGEVTPSEYERQRFELGYALQQGKHNASIDVIRNETGDAGTPALPMDISYIDSDIVRMAYGFELDNGKVSLQFQNSDIEHLMTNYHLRQAPADMMRYRSTLATGKSNDLKASLELGSKGALWRIGFDLHDSEHDADISNPNNAMFLIKNINRAENSIRGLFIETEQALNSDVQLDFGMRVNRVTADSGDVGFNGLMGMMATHATTLRDAFNNSDRRQTDNNLDFVIKLHQQLAPHWKLSTEFGQKMRSATYQERYLWIPMQSTGGLADGFTYIGNPELNPEKAHELNIGFEWNDGQTRVAPRVFYREVKDYIQGTPLVVSGPEAMAANMLANMMSGQPPLVFSNVDANLFGMDIDWHSQLTQDIALRGIVSVVRGERDDINDDLYRVSPDHASVAVDYQWQQLLSSLEVVGYAKQTRVSVTNNEQETAGYALVNAHFNYQASDSLNVGFGIENLFDREYAAHLAGINRANGSDVDAGDRIPGMGRNAYAKVKWSF